MNSRVVEANRRVHSTLVQSGEYAKSPHRRQENRDRVSLRLAKLFDQSENIIHLDVGCGDGFIFECAPRNWSSSGVDATEEMLRACQEAHPMVSLKLALAEALPFEDGVFDVITCYSFLDHLEDTSRFFCEAFRVLKPGGKFYFGLNPNRLFSSALLYRAITLDGAVAATLDLSVEEKKMHDDGAYYAETFGIDKRALEDCEPGKTGLGGMDPLLEFDALKRAGFVDVSVHYDWVVRQNLLRTEDVETLRAFLPLSGACFKYFDILGAK